MIIKRFHIGQNDRYDLLYKSTRRICEKKIIDEGIKKANVKAVSRAATVRKWIILPLDFSVKGGELTPTLKLKRAFVSKKYQKEIDNIYLSPRL